MLLRNKNNNYFFYPLFVKVRGLTTMGRKNKIILTISVLVGGGLSIFASASPDGLERVAEDQGFISAGFSLISGLIPDYVMPGISYEPLAVTLAGIFGTLITFCLIMLSGKMIRKFLKV